MADGYCTVADVASQIHTRTKASLAGGSTEGEFNAHTRPTNTDVAGIIPRASRRVYAELGAYDDIPTAQQGLAVDLVALRTAIEVELSFFTEQVDGSDSPYRALVERWEKDLPAAVAAIREAKDSGSTDAGNASGPHYSFPVLECRPFGY